MKMKRILFQGDSITDAGRDRANDFFRGNGYPTIVSGRLGCDLPNEYEFLNRGISGNRVIDLLARVKRDAVNLSPDIISILIGINDVWHEVSERNGVSTEKYETYYNMYVKELREANPDIKIMILEPFVLKGGATEEKWDAFRSDTEEKAKAAKRVASDNGLTFVPLMDRFDDLAKKAPASYWLMDGVHPTAAGHTVIADEWIRAFKKLK